jgi:hypothetical protein
MVKTILVLATNPKDTPSLRLDKEIREIDDGLQRAKARDEFILRPVLATRPDDVRRAMLKYQPDIVHFCGHGAGEDGLIFEGENGHSMLVSADTLKEFFELFADKVECVVLNACYSEAQAKAIAHHIKYVIGMKQDIEDDTATKFAVAFYDTLGAGWTIEFAYKLASNAVKWSDTPEHLAPVLLQKNQLDTVDSAAASIQPKTGMYNDVFVSYHGDDRAWAMQFVRELQEVGVRVKSEALGVGKRWMAAFRSAIEDSTSVVILVGRLGLTPWENASLQSELETLAENRYPILQVVLPDKKDFVPPDYFKPCSLINYTDPQTFLQGIQALIPEILGRKLAYSIPQIGDGFRLQMPGNGRPIFVSTLPNPHENKVFLTWETFGAGITSLRDQLDDHYPPIRAHVCVGINESGLVIASFLSDSVMKRKSKVGWVRTERKFPSGREVLETWLPETRPLDTETSPVILLCDSEIKSGTDLESVVDIVRKAYPGASIYYAVLAAMAKGTEPKINDFDQLRAKDVLRRLNLGGIFVAFTMVSPGIEPPLEVR